MTAEPPIVKKMPARRRGNALGFWFFKTSLRLFGLRGTYGLLYIVCTYYLFFDRSAVESALAYIRRRFPDHNPFRQRIDAYLLFVSQGKNLVDRFYLLAGGPEMNVPVEGWDKVTDLLKTQHGFVLLMSHLGNWQAIMTALRRINRRIFLLMRPEDNAAVAESLKLDAGGGNISVISSEDPVGSIVAIMDAIKEGGIVSIMGDRSYEFTSVNVNFLGDQAKFSCGAFHVAALAGCPVVTLLSAKTSVHEHSVRVVDVVYPKYTGDRDKKEQLRDWVQVFAKHMEDYVARYPFQCFLFYDIWKDAIKKQYPDKA